MTPSFKPMNPSWRDGYETARRQAFALTLQPGDPAHRIAQMQPVAPKYEPEVVEMMERFARQGRVKG